MRIGKRRQIEDKVLSLKDKQYGRILVFTGARQVGKTTLVKTGIIRLHISEYRRSRQTQIVPYPNRTTMEKTLSEGNIG